MPTVDVSGVPVFYSVAGNGPSLLLIHGTAGSSETNFGHLRDYFTENHTVITPDYSGSGETPLPAPDNSELTVEQLVAQVVTATREVTDAPVDVVGFSLGAVIAAAAAAQSPGLVRRLVLINGWAREDDPRQRLAVELWRRLPELDEAAFAAYSTLLIFSPAFLAAFGEAALKETVAGVKASPGTLRQIELDRRLDISHLVSTIAAPTLVVGSTQDQLIPVEHSRELHESIRGSRYAELDSGHMVLFEKPTELVDLIQDFLR
jgi:pimeloyl-ACP methyl ester carboxylesterase